MPDLKITQLTRTTQPTADDLFAGVNDPSGTPETVATTRANLGRRLVEPTAKTANYNLTSDDEVILFDVTSASRVANLPAVSGTQGKTYLIKKVDSSSNTVTITPNGAELIDGAATKVISTQNGFYILISDNTGWKVFATNEITLTGDVTGSGVGSFAATIANDAVTYAKMQNVSATDKLLGRSTAGSGDVEEITCTAAARALLDDVDAAAQRTTLGIGAIGQLATIIASFGCVIGDGTNVITTGQSATILIPYAMTITKWTILEASDTPVSGSIVIDIWKDTYANYQPTVADSITASAKPTVSSATKGQSSTLTGWTTSVSAGDIIKFNVDSVTSMKRVAVIVEGTRAT